MALTEKQKNAIHKLPIDDIIEILDECKEYLGIVSQTDYIKIMDYKYSRQNLDLDMIKGKIKHIKIGKTRYPIINCFDN